MARPPKEAGGIPYFSLDSDTFRDEKIRRIKAQCGMKGIGFLFWLLCEIYAGEGYYMRFSYDDCALLADEAGGGINAELTREVVKSSLKCSFFDCRVFENYGVLTSSRIQKNYLRACERWSTILMDRRYWLLTEKDVKHSTLIKVTLLDVIDGNNGINVYKNPVNVGDNALNIKENKNIYTHTKESAPTRTKFGDYGNVFLTHDEYVELIRMFGETGADQRINMLDRHMAQHKEYHSDDHFLTITQGWVQKAVERDQRKKTTGNQKTSAGAAFRDFNQRNYDYDELMREINGG